MKTITIRLPDVEAAMLLEVVLKKERLRGMQELVRAVLKSRFFGDSGKV